MEDVTTKLLRERDVDIDIGAATAEKCSMMVKMSVPRTVFWHRAIC